MTNRIQYDVIIVGGSYSGLAAGMALGRASRTVLIIDSGRPCNRQTPFSHNFLTQDGKPPAEITALARQQLQKYGTVAFFQGLATSGKKTENGFDIQIGSGEIFTGKKLVFATGIKDILPAIEGFSDCWGLSVLHCPYCHGYEVRNAQTGIFGHGDTGFELAKLISHWAPDLTLYTNGLSGLTQEQADQLQSHRISIVEKEIEKLDQENGQVKNILFRDGSRVGLTALYVRVPFEQHCRIPESLGCSFTEAGYLQTDAFQKTNIPGIFACGDNASPFRTLANAIAQGTAAGMMLNKEMIFESF